MTDWTGLSRELERLLHLRTYPIAYKKLETVAELEKIPGVQRPERVSSFCQLPSLVRRAGVTFGITKENLMERCARINGLADTTEEEIAQEAAALATTWFANAEEARKQLAAYPLIPPGEALLLAPLASGQFEPDVVLIYGNPAQLMMLMYGLQFKDYERFQFFFIGEGACADALAQCYISGKPALAVPCFGERAFGCVTEDELVIALPPRMVGKAIEGLQAIEARGFKYPVFWA
jgi:uncharacterized protein (DUF169 family)